MMTRVFRDEWSAALRSGRFAQTRGDLHRLREDIIEDEPVPAGYCCIGVRCELDVEAGKMAQFTGHAAPVVQYGELERETHLAMPSQETRLRWGLDDQLMLYPEGVAQGFAAPSSILVLLNDDCKWSFEQIADWLDTLPVTDDK